MNGLLSVVVPAYNEEAALPASAAAITGALDRAGVPFELIYVDDGSQDGTWSLIQKLSAADPRIRGVSFSRNFGKDPAIFAGLSRAAGDCCAVLDCDLQHPPEVLPEMYRLWQEGWQVVEGVKAARSKESPLYRLCAGLFYSLISRTAGLDMRRSSDFRLLDRQVVDALLAVSDRGMFFRALSSWVGFRRTRVEFSVAERVAGTSKWSFTALLRYALFSIVSFSSAPLHIATALGCVLLPLTVLLAVIMLAAGGASASWLALFAVLDLLAVGCLLICLGILGLYVGRILRQAGGRPDYIIADECGVSHEKADQNAV